MIKSILLAAVISASSALAASTAMIKPPRGFRVYVLQRFPDKPSANRFMGNVSNGSAFSFRSPATMTVAAMNVRVRIRGSNEGGTDVWTCSNGKSSGLSVSLPGGSKKDAFLTAHGSLSMREGDLISCRWKGRGKTPPFADVVLSGS